MANNKLNEKDLERLSKLLQEGKTPQDIASYFNVAISTVHNYKSRLKAKGIPLPDVRGQRPKGMSFKKFPDNHSIKDGMIYFKVNDVSFFVETTAKSVKIQGDNTVIVKF